MTLLSRSIQFTGAVGVSNCAGGPRVRFLTGRPNISEPSPDLLVPEPDNTTDELIERFTDAGLDTVTMIDLLVSHTVAAQVEFVLEAPKQSAYSSALIIPQHIDCDLSLKMPMNARENQFAQVVVDFLDNKHSNLLYL